MACRARSGHDSGIAIESPQNLRPTFPAGLVRNLLTENDIECQTVEKLRGNIGTPYTEVWVLDDSDREQALRLIESLDVEPGAGDSWECDDCGETNPPAFAICWACSHERISDAV